MKNLKVLSVILLLAIPAGLFAQRWEIVRGDHNVVKKERDAGSFTKIKVSTGIDVYLSQGSRESITVEADENLHKYILTEIRNGELNVYTEVGIRDAERKRVHVTMPNITALRTTSAGDIIGQTPIKSDILNFQPAAQEASISILLPARLKLI
jgi:uncharacterized protein YxeA